MNSGSFVAVGGGMGTLVAVTALAPDSSFASPGWAASMVAMLTMLGSQSSPWSQWMGALPLNRHRWLARALVVRTGALAALLVPFWAALAWVAAGMGWTAWLSTNASALVLSLMAAPWSVPVGLTQRPGSMAGRGWILGMLGMVAWISGASVLGTTPLGLAVATASVFVSWVGAAASAHHILTTRKGR